MLIIEINRKLTIKGESGQTISRDASDTYELPTPDILTGLTDYTKHCFWINNKFLETIIGENKTD